MVVSTLSNVTSCVRGGRIIGGWVVKVAFMLELEPELLIVKKRGAANLRSGGQSTGAPTGLVPEDEMFEHCWSQG
jgi:hypothetical protein